MNDLARALTGFRVATGCEAAVWTPAESGLQLEARTSRAPTLTDVPVLDGSRDAMDGVVDTPDGELLVALVPGPRRAWLAVGPCHRGDTGLPELMRFLLPVVTHYLQSALEVEHAANELAERYEEINLLYTISEILGRTVSLEEAAQTILTEISETVGARRASILVYDPPSGLLRTVAALGATVAELPPVEVGDPTSISAAVFRTQHPVLVSPDQTRTEHEVAYGSGELLSVPIMWTAPGPDGAQPLGVVNLAGRRSGQPFTAGDQKLIAAIATQIGTAIQNARLVRASLEQQRLSQEMQVAHDLQMKLLPDARLVAPQAIVSARVVPAESVGGDFYNLFRLGPERTGVIIGDVSGHGYQAALIMALSMSAAAIHSQSIADPGEMLHALATTLRDELETTEMFISMFYGVVDRGASELVYANTGHPHAFHCSGTCCERLKASDPPLGMDERRPRTERRPWNSETDVLVLFTDGISDARDARGERLGEQAVLDAIRANLSGTPEQVCDRVLELVRHHSGGAPQRDDLTVVVLRS
jgi:sigma-B regulation protein RsbU (phosphoserine phosphatase)